MSSMNVQDSWVPTLNSSIFQMRISILPQCLHSSPWRCLGPESHGTPEGATATAPPGALTSVCQPLEPTLLTCRGPVCPLLQPHEPPADPPQILRLSKLCCSIRHSYSRSDHCCLRTKLLLRLPTYRPHFVKKFLYFLLDYYTVIQYS